LPAIEEKGQKEQMSEDKLFLSTGQAYREILNKYSLFQNFAISPLSGLDKFLSPL